MNKTKIFLLAAAAIAAGCAAMKESDDAQRAKALAMMKASFKEHGQAKLDRLDQDEVQRTCSQYNADKPIPKDAAERLEKAQLADIKYPADGKFLGDWKSGEKIAQTGVGMQYSDDPKVPAGGNCYACHQLTKAEVSFGTIGPSLYNYGKLRGVTDPASAASEPIVKYTWGKLWNAKAYSACSNMPRFGHAGLLDEAQLRHLMALLLDPKSPVNQ
jgi:sulfur-oxidizing protein SoxX